MNNWTNAVHFLGRERAENVRYAIQTIEANFKTRNGRIREQGFLAASLWQPQEYQLLKDRANAIDARLYHTRETKKRTLEIVKDNTTMMRTLINQDPVNAVEITKQYQLYLSDDLETMMNEVNAYCTRIEAGLEENNNNGLGTLDGVAMSFYQ